MKKKLLAIASGCVVAASLMIAGIASDGKSDGIFDENVEALAVDEESSDVCFWYIHESKGRRVRDCNTCEFTDGTDYWWCVHSLCPRWS